MLIRAVAALDIGDGVRIDKAGQGIDMGVGVIPGEVAVLQPQEALNSQVRPQSALYLRQRHSPVAVGVEQAGVGAEQGTESIGFDGAAFQYEVHLAQGHAVTVLAVDFAVDRIVETGAVLVTPGIELEVEEFRW